MVPTAITTTDITIMAPHHPFASGRFRAATNPAGVAAVRNTKSATCGLTTVELKGLKPLCFGQQREPGLQTLDHLFLKFGVD